MAPGLWDSVLPSGAEPSRFEDGGVQPDVWVLGPTCPSDGSPGNRGTGSRLSDGACTGSEPSQELLEPSWAPALMHHQVPRVFGLVLQCVQAHVQVVLHCRRH